YFRLPDGRDMTLGSLHFLSPYSLGKTPGCKQELEERIPQLVREYYPGDRIPFVIRWPDGLNFPTTLCIASFYSKPIALKETEGISWLIVCWFVWHLDRHIREIVDPGLAGLEWEKHALDCSWW